MEGGCGNPSSLTVPSSDAEFGRITSRSEPASTVGGSFTGLTVMLTAAAGESTVPSFAIKVKLSEPLKFPNGV
jgi:hypothetical protein